MLILGLLYTVCLARVLARVFLGYTVTKGDQQPAADITNFYSNKIFLEASNLNIFFLTAQHLITGINYMGRTIIVPYFSVTLIVLLRCMICI